MKKIKAIIVALLLMSIISAFLLLIASLIIAKAGVLPGNFAGLLTTVIACVSVFSGSYLVTFRMKEQGLFYGFAAASAFVFLILMVSLVVYRNTFDFSSIWKLFAILITGAIGGVLGVNRKNKVKF